MHTCPKCSAELGAAVPLSGHCPRCGTPLVRPDAPPDASARSPLAATLDSSDLPEPVGDHPPSAGAHAAPPPRYPTPNVTAMYQTFREAGLSPDEARDVTQIWRGTFSPATTPRMTLKQAGEPAGRKSTLVVKTRNVRPPAEFDARTSDYELLSVIGEGGMGVVYAARQASIDRTVAVKMLQPELVSDTDQRSKFLSEAVVTGDLEHPNIVPIYDLGANESGALFYSMKRVQGTPWLDQLPRKSLNDNLEILLRVADAVAFAHSRGVIHRDLKPENVMLGDFGEVLVMDWGLALATPSFRKVGSITQTHSMGGTPAYMAPEMATGPIEVIGPASDIYLLGAVLFEIITRRPPHTGDSVMSCLKAAARNEIVASEHSGELLDIALQAMATDPLDRFPTVQAFQAAIRQYQAHSESLALVARAQQDLTQARESNDYQDYARSLFGFQEALALWPGNERAAPGLSAARLAYAASALDKADYDLGLSLLEADNTDHDDLRRRLQQAQAERDARQVRLRNIKRLVAALSLAMVAVVGVSYVQITIGRNRAIQAEQEANKQKIAEQQARRQAENLFGQLQQQYALLDVEKRRVESEKQRADDEKQRALTEKNRAEQATIQANLAKEKEQYEAYVAQIGLAAAKINENAFENAELLLANTPRDLRHWEWGRLMHLCRQNIRTFDAAGPVDAVDFAPDGARFVTASWDGRLRIWQTDTGQLLQEIPYGGLYVHAAAFSPDGRLVAAGGNDTTGYARLFDAQTGQLVHTLAGHTDAVVHVAFSRDGSRLLTSSYDHSARLWDVSTGRLIRTFLGHTWWVWSASFSPDESQIVTASQDGAVIVWSAESGRPRPPFTGHRGPVYTAAFSPDGRQVASAGYDHRVLLWEPGAVRPFDYRAALSGQPTVPPEFVALDAHQAPVRSVQFSRDGRRLVSAGHDNTVAVWNVENAAPIKILRGHAGWVRACRFSPDGRLVLSGSHDHRAMLWDVDGCEEVRVLKARVLTGHEDAVLDADFSADGRRIVTASRDRTARLWNLDSAAPELTFEEGHTFLATRAVFFDQGLRLLTAGGDNTARVWDVTTGTELLRLDRTGRTAAAAVAPDGQTILTGGDDLAATLWHTATGQVRHKLAGHARQVTTVAFSSDGRHAATGDGAGVVRLWDTTTAQLVKTLRGHSRKIVDTAFHPDAKRLLTASGDNTVAQWDLDTGSERLDLVLKHPDAVTSMALRADGRHALTTAADGLVRLWDVDRAALLACWSGGGELLQSVAFSPDQRHALAVDALAARLWRWPLEPPAPSAAPQPLGTPLLELGDKGGSLWAAAFAPDGAALLTVGGNSARLWNVAASQELINFSPHGAVAGVAFSPDGTRVVSASWDNSAKIWDARTGKALLKLAGVHRGYVNTAVFSPDGQRVVTAGDDGLAVVWEAAQARPLVRLEGHEDRVRSATFSPDGVQILTASTDRTARIWDARTGRQLRQLRGHTWGLLRASYSADGRKIVTAAEDNSARVWDAQSGEQLVQLDGHTAAVTDAVFSPIDSRRVLTGSQDNTVKLWDAGTGKEILTLQGHAQEVTSVAFSPDGVNALTTCRDGTAILWLAVAEDWGPIAAPPHRTRAIATARP